MMACARAPHALVLHGTAGTLNKTEQPSSPMAEHTVRSEDLTNGAEE